MIYTVFCPDGIVIATAASRTYVEEGMPYVMDQIPNSYLFWGQYALLYYPLSPNTEAARLPLLWRELEKRWETAPTIGDFVPYLKKTLADSNMQLIGVVAGYSHESGAVELAPYLYQILGDSMRRVNANEEGRVHNGFLCLEKEPVCNKLFRPIKMQNGEQWEDYPETQVRVDLFSIDKAIDICSFAVKTQYYAQAIPFTRYDTPLAIDLAVVTPFNQEIKQIKI